MEAKCKGERPPLRPPMCLPSTALTSAPASRRILTTLTELWNIAARCRGVTFEVVHVHVPLSSLYTQVLARRSRLSSPLFSTTSSSRLRIIATWRTVQLDQNRFFSLNSGIGVERGRRSMIDPFISSPTSESNRGTNTQKRICVSRHQGSNSRIMIAEGSVVERRERVVVQQVHVGTGLQEDRHNVRVHLGGVVQR